MGASGEHLLDSGRLADARRQFWLEVEDADRAGDAEQLARAALGLGGVWVHEHRSIVERTRVLEVQRRALAGVDPESALAGRLRTRLAAEEGYLVQDGSVVLAELEAARRDGDPRWIADALSLVHHLLLGPEHSEYRLDLANQLIAASAATLRTRDMLQGLVWRTVDLFLAADRHALRSLAELRERLSWERCDCFAYVVAGIDVMLAVRAGRLAEARDLADRCFEFGNEVGDADAIGWYGAQMVGITWFEGRAAEMLPVVSELAHSTSLATPNEAFFAAVAVLAVAAGEHDEARSALASLTLPGLRTIPHSSNWLATILGVCEAAHLLDDVSAAHDAYELLRPFAGLPVMVSLAVICFGSAHRPLGLAAATLGELDLAVLHLEQAASNDLALGHHPAHAVDCATLADLLNRRGAAGDHDRAASLRATAVVEARRSQMDTRADEWEATSKRRHATLELTCERVHQGWRVKLGGHQAVVPDSIGMEYLAALITRRDDSVPCLELVSGHAVTMRGSAGDPVLDERARLAYRRRIEELQQDVDEAEADADSERAARARLELDRFVEELARTTGFAGRPRTFGDEAERARVSVNKALKRALQQLLQSDREIGEYIAVRLVTGLRCTLHREPRR